MPRTQLFALVALSCLVGCSRSTDPVAVALETLEPPLAQAFVQGDNTLTVAGVWTFTVDASTLDATLVPKAIRTGSQTDDTYALSVDRFFRPTTLVFRQIRNFGAQISVSFDVIHPFPAPFNPEEPATGFGNRADLGFSGILALLGEVPSATGNTYFGDRVLNTEIMNNPHGYFSPEGLLPLSLTANTFPYRLVVHDEIGGNRHQTTNGGDPRGNFGADGWTRAELGPNRTDWSGYNVLHQGQSSYIAWNMPRTYLETHSPVSMDIALIAKYNDPRGGATGDEKRINRLPPATPDTAIFGYRMPHGTWDVSQVIVRPEGGGFQTNEVSSSLIRVSVEDFDVFSPETTRTDLSLDPNPRAVNVGEAGFPAIDVCIPGVLGGVSAFESFTPASDVTDDDSAYVDGDAAADSGRPYDTLFFEHAIPKPAATTQASGTYAGLVRVSDPEVDVDTGYLPLDPNLAPLSSNLPEPVTYQTFTVSMSEGGSGTGWATLLGGGDAVVDARSIVVDPQNNVFVGGSFSAPTDFGGGERTPVGLRDSFVVSYDQAGDYRWDRVWGNLDGDFVVDLALHGATQETLLVLGGYEGTIDVGTGPIPGDLGNDLLLVGLDRIDGDILLAVAQGGATDDYPLQLAVDAINHIVIAGYSQGDTKIFGVDIPNLSFSPWIARGPSSMDSLDLAQSINCEAFPIFTQLTTDADSSVIATGGSAGILTIDGVEYPGFGGDDVWVAKFGTDGTADWVNVYGDDNGSGTVVSTAIAVTPAPSKTILLAGYAYDATVNFGGGPHVISGDPSDPFLVRLEPDGDWIVENWYGSTFNYEYIGAIHVMASGDILFSGSYESVIDLGGGTRNSHNDEGDTLFLQRSGSNWSYLWDAIWDGGGPLPYFQDIASGPGGNIVLLGSIDGEFDANPGAGTQTLTPAGEDDGVVIQLPGTPGW